ncbi:hypothetical protein LXL04_039722 [Taraxacum kok-saghyz]
MTQGLLISIDLLQSLTYSDKAVMTIDKRWTTLRNRNSDEFWDGLNKFIEIIKEQADIDGKIPMMIRMKGTTIDEEFAELFEEMNTELYPGCTWLSSLTSTANLLHMKAMNKWTHSSFDQLMKFLKVRTHIPPYYFTWDVVPDEDKARILPRVESFFDIGRNTRNWQRINEGINRYCGRRYSNRKSKLHDHFKTQGGPNNVDRARRNPPPSLRPVDWNKLIDDVFMDSNWQDRSKQNSNNRKNQPMNPETRQIQGAIDNWHNNHYKEIGGWPNKAAKLAYEKLVAEREKEVQSQQASSSSSSNGITVNEREIFQKVFGERRGHTVGIGRKLKCPSGLPSSSTISAPVSYETMQKTIQEVVRVTQEASDRHH